MKRLLLFILSLICLITNVSAQHVAIQADKHNLLYIGIPNPLTIVAEKYSCNSIVIKTDQGTIYPRDAHHYELMVATPGKVKVEIFSKVGGKKLGEAIFIAKYLPDPIARIGGKKSGEMLPLSIFKAQLGITAYFDGFEICGRYEIVSFNMIVMRSNKSIFAHENKGGRFDDTINYFKSELRRDDKVILTDIVCITPDGKKRHITPYETTIE